jgi:hypothetical protein
MRTVPLALALIYFLAPQEPPDLDKQVDQLVGQLKALWPDADRDAFLGRPSMSKLMSLGPKAFPRLKKHFLETKDWRLKASVGYLAVLLGRNDGDVAKRWRELCKDPDIIVRMVMVSLTDQFPHGCIVQMPVMTPEEKAVFDRINLPSSLHWMSEEDLKSLAVNALAVLKEGKLLVDPPQVDSIGMSGPDPNPKRLRSSGVRQLTAKASMAQLCLGRAMEASKTHEVVVLIMEAAESDDGSDPVRLGYRLRMAATALWHPRCCESEKCPEAPVYKRRIFALCEKWAWKVTDPNAQYGVLSALGSIGLWKSYDLRERLSKEHPDEQVREFAGNDLIAAWNRMYDRKYTREQEAEDDRKLEAEKQR